MWLLFALACAGIEGTPMTIAPPVVRIDAPAVGLRDVPCIGEHPDARAILAYAWFLDGALAHQGAILPATLLEPGDTWTCRVRAAVGQYASEIVDTPWTVPEAPGGNVLVLMIDDIGLDKVGVYGVHDAAFTPHMDALAEQGVRFQNVYAAPTCSPARAVALTGRYGARSGVGVWMSAHTEGWELPVSEYILPEVLAESRSLAYADAAVGKWHLASHLSTSGAGHPLAAGFSSFSGSIANIGTGGLQLGTYFRWEKIWSDGSIAMTTVYATTDVVDETLERVAELPEPWLVWAGLHAAHVPLHEPPAELHTGTIDDPTDPRQTYPAVVEALDAELGRLLASIDPALLARTTVVLVGDNGTPGHAVLPPLDPLVDAKGTVHEGGVRVPLVISGPLVGAARVSDELVHLADLLPTLADLAGVPLTRHGEGYAFVTREGVQIPIDGRSLLPHLVDPTVPVERTVLYSELFEPNGPPPWAYHDRTVRDRHHKLIRYDDGHEELYALGDTLDEGPDLLAGTLDPEAADAYARLTVEMDAAVENVRFESPGE